MENKEKNEAGKVSPIRLIDTGDVSYLRSQTIYHGLAYAKTPDTPDTIVLNRPVDPYVCIGYHGVLHTEVDVAYCNATGLPILRRETGGGTVYLDEDQLFSQWIFAAESLPFRNDQRFILFTKPLIATYQYFDIDAYAFPPNDVHVKGKKIVGTGAATIGMAEVMTGNFLFDFDYSIMSKILNLPDDNYRKLTYESLSDYMTTIRREVDEVPSMERLKSIYIEACGRCLDRPIIRGRMTAEELKSIQDLDKKFLDKEWIYDGSTSDRKNRLVKINANVWLFETSNVTKTGVIIQILMRTKGKLINDISISGNVLFNPTHKLEAFEKYLVNIEIEKQSLTEAIEVFYQLHGIETQGVEVEDWVQTIMRIREKNAITVF